MAVDSNNVTVTVEIEQQDLTKLLEFLKTINSTLYSVYSKEARARAYG